MAHGNAGYTDRYRHDHEAAQRAEEEEQRERERANADVRRDYLAGLKAKRDAKQAEHHAAIDAALAPQMAAAEREWRIAHPGRDFAQVRDLVRAQLIEEQDAAARDETTRHLMAGGKYTPL